MNAGSTSADSVVFKLKLSSGLCLSSDSSPLQPCAQVNNQLFTYKGDTRQIIPIMEPGKCLATSAKHAYWADCLISTIKQRVTLGSQQWDAKVWKQKQIFQIGTSLNQGLCLSLTFAQGASGRHAVGLDLCDEEYTFEIVLLTTSK